jgi:hypothetical protein
MKIHEIEIRNFAGIEAANFSPRGDSLLITGANATGKTSILRAIHAAFVGIDEEDIRAGADEARVYVALDEHTIERSCTRAGKKKIVVKLRDSGAIVHQPQSVLNSISTTLDFEPLRFAQYAQREQRNVLLRTTGATIDGKDIIGRLLKSSLDNKRLAEDATQIATFVTSNAGDVTTDNLVDACAEYAKIAYQRRAELNASVSKLEDLIDAFNTISPQIEDDDVVKMLRGKREQWQQQVNALVSEAKAFDLAHSFFKDELLDEIAEESLFTATPGIIYTRKRGVTIGGVDFASLSSSEQMTAVLDIASALHRDGALCMILIDGVERYDGENWKRVSRWIDETGVQALVSQVTFGARVVSVVKSTKREAVSA